MGRFDEAEALFDQAIGRVWRLRPVDRERLRLLSLCLAGVSWSRGDYERAEAMYREHLGDDAAIASSLGVVLRDQGRFEEARPLLRTGLDHLVAISRLGSIWESNGLVNLARLEFMAGNYDLAERLAVRALEIRGQWLPDQHTGVAEARRLLALIHSATNRFLTAEKLLGSALAI